MSRYCKKFASVLLAGSSLLLPAFLAGQITPNPGEVFYNHSELSSSVTKTLNIGCPDFSGPDCEFTTQEALVKASLNLGDDYDFGDIEFIVAVDFTIEALPPSGITEKYEGRLEIGQDQPEALFFGDLTSLCNVISPMQVTINNYGIAVADIQHRPALEQAVNFHLFMDITYREKVEASGTPNITITPFSGDVNDNPVTFQWSNTGCPVSNYEFQLLRLYNIDPARMDSHNIEATVDWSKALTIETGSEDTELTLTLSEGTGFYCWRVRAIGNYYPDGIANPDNWGDWSAHTPQGSTTVFAASGNDVFFYEQFDVSFNFIHSRIYAEGNKQKETMVYANGLQQVKENQVHLFEEDNVVVTKTYHDFSGRPALTVLPVPVDGKEAFGFVGDLVYNDDPATGDPLNPIDFDQDDNFDNPASSPVHLHIDDPYYNGQGNDHVPFDERYPYSRTLFWNDGTERVREQSNVGAQLSIGSGHTNRTFFNNPADAELTRIFGDEAPDKNSVFKTINIDPNGTTSVSYINKQGQTIATCLSSTANNPTNLDPLPSAPNDPVQILETLDDKIAFGEDGAKVIKTIFFAEPTDLTLNYEVIRQNLSYYCEELCTACDYTIDFLIREMDGNFADTRTFHIPGEQGIADCGDETTYDQTTAGYEDFNHTYPGLVGPYHIEMRIYANTVDPNTNNTYLAAHRQQLQNVVDADINTALASYSAYLDENGASYGNLEGLYDDLENDVAFVLDQESYYTLLPCEDTLRIPLIDCDKGYDNCRDPDFEQMLYDRWNTGEDPLGDTPLDYFYTGTAPTYIQNHVFEAVITVENYGGFPPNPELEELLVNGENILGDPVTYDNPVNTAVEIKNEINSHQNVYTASVNVFPNNDQIILTAQLSQGADHNGMIEAVFSPEENSFLTMGSFELVNEPQVPFPYGHGAFNGLIEHMLTDGYDCDRLYECWIGLIEAYEVLAYIDGDREEGRREEFDLLEAFLDCAGREYRGFSDEAFGSTGYLERAYQYFYYDPAIATPIQQTCINFYTAEGLTDADIPPNTYAEGWIPDARGTLQDLLDQGIPEADYEKHKRWETLYQCIRYGSDDPSLLPSPAELNEDLEEECIQACEDRYESFVEAIKELYLDNNYTITQDGIVLEVPDTAEREVGPAPPGFVDIFRIECLARQLVCHCMDYCDLTVIMDPQMQNILSIGTSQEIENVQNAMTADFEIQFPDPDCPAGFTTIDPFSGSNDNFLENSGFGENLPGIDPWVIFSGEAGYVDGYMRMPIGGDICHAGIYQENIDVIEDQSYFVEFDILNADNFGHIDSFVIRLASSDFDPTDLGELCEPADYPADFLEQQVIYKREDLNIEDDWIRFSGTFKSLYESPAAIYIYGANTDDDIGQLHLDNVALWECSWDEVCFRWIPLEDIPIEDAFVYEPIPCEQTGIDFINYSLEQQGFELKEKAVGELELAYQSTCMENFKDSFTLAYELAYHHYTLYYYDRAGNLVKTVPPEGVNGLTPTEFNDHNARDQYHNDHNFETEYDYNSLKQLVRQLTPDGGETKFVYDDKGQLRFSQNARQAGENAFSYTKYDELGRIIEVGESQEADWESNANDPDFPTTGSEKVITVYSEPYEGVVCGGNAQRFLRNRVSYSYTDKDGNEATTHDQVYSFFSYDPHGNVEWLVQQLPELGRKTIAYDYDLVSGNVNRVRYNEGKADQFYHRYAYDSDNRIVSVATSRDGVIWETDGSYDYYPHGPLQRTVLGEDKVQGMDYVYTLQGWLKGMNHPGLNATDDPGQDGNSTIASRVGKDAFAMTLGYYNGDFMHSNSPFDVNQGLEPFGDPEHRDLFNGNISAWVTNTQPNPDGEILEFEHRTANIYHYDELNRLTESMFRPLVGGSYVASDDYSTALSYDANGNIDSLDRHAYRHLQDMDDLVYEYWEDGNGKPTNKLRRIIDNATVSGQMDDLEHQPIDNYYYDDIGNLIEDKAEGLNIEWNLQNKVSRVIKTDAVIDFEYDATGNRVLKRVTQNTGDETATYYVRDASGNIMAIYQKQYDGVHSTFSLEEVPLYGSSRIGEYRSQKVLATIEGAIDATQGFLQTSSKTESVKWLIPTSQGPKLVDFTLSEKAELDDIPGYAGLSVNTAVMLDECDQFLFGAYTNADPLMVYRLELLNRDMQPMSNPNGLSLAAETSPNANPVILKKPGTKSEYYVIYCPDTHGGKSFAELQYIIVDMSRDGGKGAIVSTVGQPVIPGFKTGFHMAPVSDANGNHRLFVYGPVATGYGIYTIDVTQNGFEAPQLQGTKPLPGKPPTSPQNEIAISPGGQYLAMTVDAQLFTGNLVLFDLDMTCGQLSNRQSIDVPIQTMVHVEFSPSSNYLYFIGQEPGVSLYGRVNLKNNQPEVINKLGFGPFDDIQRGVGCTMYISATTITGNGLFRLSDPEAEKGTAITLIDLGIFPPTARPMNSLPQQTHHTTTKMTAGPGCAPLFGAGMFASRPFDQKQYELTDHLGNVRALVGDRKLSTINLTTNEPEDFTADLLAYNNYYPFGWGQPGRSFQSNEYRFGFNGMEKDDEVSGNGNSYTAPFWQFDPRLGTRWNPDPITYPWQGAYSCFNNNPILYSDPLGLYGQKKAERKRRRAIRKGYDVGEVYQSGDKDEKAYGFAQEDKNGVWVHRFGRKNRGTSIIEGDIDDPTKGMSSVEIGRWAINQNRIDVTLYGSNDVFNNLLQNAGLSFEEKRFFFNLRVVAGPARQAGEEIANGLLLLASAAQFVAAIESATLGVGANAAKEAPKYLYHYTSREAAQSISQNGLRIGRDGFSYLTNKSTLQPLQAQIELALPANRALPNSLLRINTSGLTPVATRRVQGNLPNLGAGGGTEFIFNQHIPAGAIKIIR